MLKFFGKNHLSTLLALVLFSSMSSLVAEECYDSSTAEECCYSTPCNRFYIGGFGGRLYSNSTRMTQRGTAYFTEAEGGPLAVDARGNSNRSSTGFGGLQVGYEWRNPSYDDCSNWNFTRTAEIEAFWYRHTKRGDLLNPSVRLPEHDFVDSFPMKVGVYLVNGIISLNSCNLGNFIPYVGGGIGAANIHIRRASSTQIAPPEFGINHFNSDRSDSCWTFAAQAKAGIRYNICDRIHIFGEYRFLYVDSSRYIFGSTMYPTHAPTSPWNVDIKDICYNAFVFGLQFDL